MTNKKETAQKIMEAFYKDWTDDEHIDDKPAVVNVLRELVFQLQYYHFGDGEDMVVSSRAILDVCEELEKCYKNQIEQEKEQIKQNLKLSLKNYD